MITKIVLFYNLFTTNKAFRMRTLDFQKGIHFKEFDNRKYIFTFRINNSKNFDFFRDNHMIFHYKSND